MDWEELFFYPQQLLHERLHCLHQDILTFMEHCIKELLTITVGDLAELWSKHDLSVIHMSLLEEESEQEFFELYLDVLQKLFVESLQSLDKTVLFYLIYVVLMSMPLHLQHVALRVNVQFLTQLNEFIKRSRDQNNPEPAILYYLLWTKQKVILSTRTSLHTYAISQTGLPLSVVHKNKAIIASGEKSAEVELELAKQLTASIESSEAYERSKTQLFKHLPELQAKLRNTNTHLLPQTQGLMKSLGILRK